MKRAPIVLLAILSAAPLCARADRTAPSPQSALAPATISLAELLSRVAHAEGDRAPGTYHIVLRSNAQGGEVTTEDTYVHAADYKTTKSSPGVSSSWGSLNGQAWFQNDNGIVRTLSGLPGKRDPMQRALSDMNAPSSGSKLVGTTAGPPAEYVVEVAPQDGLKERRYYDATTYLVASIEFTDYDGKTRTVEYGDYRNVAGVMVPFVRTESSDLSNVKTRYIVESYQSIPTNAALFSVPASRLAFAFTAPGPVTIPADFTDRGIIVRLNVGDRGLDLLLDSGASSIVINAAVARDLQLVAHSTHAVSLGGIFAEASASLNDVSIGTLHADTLAINVAPVEARVSPGERAVGLLGCDFIANGALSVDFAHKSLKLYPTVPADLIKDGWTELPASLDDCVPMVKATISGKEGLFILDLGAFSTVLYPHYFAEYGTPDINTPETAAGRFIGGQLVHFKQYRMKTVVMGDLTFSDAMVMVPSTDSVQDRTYDGLIGRTWLENFNLLFDYDDQKIYIKPAQ